MDIEVRHLRLVRAVAALGGLTRAGRELHLTQSALSHQLRDVEARLGTPLFLRVGRRMLLTNAGERLLRSADEVLGTLDRTEAAIRSFANGRRGRLRVTTGGFTEYHWLPSVLRAYRGTRPTVDVQVVGGAGANVVQLLLEGAVDLGIVSHPIDDGRVVTRPLFQDEIVAVVAPDSPLSSKTLLRPEDLADVTLLLDAPDKDHAIYRHIAGGAGLRVGSIQFVAQTGAIVELVKAGLGVGVLTRWAVEPYVRAGALREVTLAGEGARCEWRAAVLKEMAEVAYVREFIELIARLRPGGNARAATPPPRPVGAPKRS